VTKVDAFGRILTAMITPMKENGEVDFDSAAKLACHLVETGSEGIVVSGTTGESPVLSSEEKCQLLKVVREAVSGKASVIAGTGSNDTAATIELTKEAEAIIGRDSNNNRPLITHMCFYCHQSWSIGNPIGQFSQGVAGTGSYNQYIKQFTGTNRFGLYNRCY
jgi:hypothetical protein